MKASIIIFLLVILILAFLFVPSSFGNSEGFSEGYLGCPGKRWPKPKGGCW